MKLPPVVKYSASLLVAFLGVLGITARAGGPLLVGGLPPYVEGVPFRWNINPLTYWTDRGNLGNQSKAEADALVAQAFQVWQDVPTASIQFSAVGELSADVTADNITDVLNDLGDCDNPLSPIAQPRTIIYDVNGTATEALGEDKTSVLGFASAACWDSNGTENFFTRGYAVLNGLWIDGQPDSTSNPEISLSEFRGVLVHEFGHLIGLDHSQVNVNCFTSAVCPPSDLAGVPTMFPFIDPFLGNDEIFSLSADDKAVLSELYPTADFPATTGRIHGHIRFSDGETPAQGFNVVARRVGDPRRIAVASVSGFLFTEDAGNPIVQIPGWTPSPFGSRDQTLIGFYDIPGLSPGDHTIEVEAIDPEFVGGSSISPIGVLGFQFPMPGSCASEFANTTPPESNSDSCTDQTPVPVTAGMVTDAGTDIILNGTPPRFDAWEDE